jgi:hypothetical protein
MTTYAPTFTPRLKVSYKNGRIAHTIQVRGGRGSSLATMSGMVDPVANCFVALAAYLLNDFAWIQAEVALTDEETFVPVPVSGITVTGGVALTTQSAITRIRGLTISGRAAGSRARFTMFTPQFAANVDGSEGADGVITATEIPALTTIAGIANTYFRANSGDTALWRNHGTYKGNDHLLKLVRRGIVT